MLYTQFARVLLWSPVVNICKPYKLINSIRKQCGSNNWDVWYRRETRANLPSAMCPMKVKASLGVLSVVANWRKSCSVILDQHVMLKWFMPGKNAAGVSVSICPSSEWMLGFLMVTLPLVELSKWAFLRYNLLHSMLAISRQISLYF